MHRLVFCLLIGVVLLHLFQPRSARAQKTDLQAMREAMTLAGRGKVLAAIHKIESQKLDEQIASQTLATLYSFVGEDAKAEQLISRRFQDLVVEFPAGAGTAPAIESIVAAAGDRQLVIVNEAHCAPRHREFLRRLADRLREDGFAFYALEALNENAERLRSRGYPVRWSGFYTNEPVFGQLLRSVLKQGYSPVAYEALFVETTGETTADINAREQIQCDNLVARIFDKHPQARVLVHVGHAHVMETPRTIRGEEIRWLAARLKQTTGIDPLTIDQTSHLKFADETDEPHDAPVVVTDSEGGFLVGGHFAGAVDLQVFHPPLHNRDGRPAWRYAADQCVAVPLPAEITVDEGRLLIQAYFADEPTEAVPADQFLLSADGPRPPLLLRPGTYRIVTQDHEGNETARQPLSVPTAGSVPPVR